MRDKLDRYYTPDAVAKACIEVIDAGQGGHRPMRLLEPSVGGGAFVRAARAKWGDDTWAYGVDADPNAKGLAECNAPRMGSLMDVELPARDLVDLVVGNPPYMHAHAHTKRLLDAGYDVVALLLRLGFLASRARVGLWERYPLAELHTLSQRPSFTANGQTDQYDYALFVWRRPHGHNPQRINWIAHELGGRGRQSIRWRTV